MKRRAWLVAAGALSALGARAQQGAPPGSGAGSASEAAARSASGAAAGTRSSAGSNVPSSAASSAISGEASGPASSAASSPAAAELAARTLVFPRDFGAHPAFAIEWWYATGLLQAAKGATGATGETGAQDPDYGFQLTFFRSRTGLAEGNRSRFAARQLLFAHAALTDLRSGRFLHAQRIARWSGDEGAAGARASTADTRVRLGDWQLERSGPASESVYRARLGDADAGFAFELELRSTQPVMLQGHAGYSRKGPRPGQASHYYSQPQLAVRGSLGLRQAGGAGPGRAPAPRQALAVSGRAWLDHEWSSSLLDPQAVGWDWAGLNLDDGAALTVFRLRRADGSALWAGGSYRPRGGTTRDFGPQELRMTPGRLWTSPASQARYPVQWRLDTPAGSFTLRALADAQELDSRSSTGSVYWEGASELLEPGGRRVGAGYLEMTGYVSPLRLGG